MKTRSETLKMAQEELIKKMQEEITSLKNEINNVQSTVKNLEHSVTKLKSEVSVSQQVTALLKQELDRQQQYSRRSCLLIKNISTSTNETIQEVEGKVCDEIAECFSDKSISDTVIQDIDKAHRVGPQDGLKQDHCSL